MRGFFALVLFSTFTTELHAATINYDAFVACNNNCVTVSLSWQNLFVPLFITVVVRTVNIFPTARLPKNID